jgi:hypothetical protein
VAFCGEYLELEADGEKAGREEDGLLDLIFESKGETARLLAWGYLV